MNLNSSVVQHMTVKVMMKKMNSDHPRWKTKSHLHTLLRITSNRSIKGNSKSKKTRHSGRGRKKSWEHSTRRELNWSNQLKADHHCLLTWQGVIRESKQSCRMEKRWSQVFRTQDSWTSIKVSQAWKLQMRSKIGTLSESCRASNWKNWINAIQSLKRHVIRPRTCYRVRVVSHRKV